LDLTLYDLGVASLRVYLVSHYRCYKVGLWHYLYSEQSLCAQKALWYSPVENAVHQNERLYFKLEFWLIAYYARPRDHASIRTLAETTYAMGVYHTGRPGPGV
jgi:hypothetical protein